MTQQPKQQFIKELQELLTKHNVNIQPLSYDALKIEFNADNALSENVTLYGFGNETFIKILNKLEK